MTSVQLLIRTFIWFTAGLLASGTVYPAEPLKTGEIRIVTLQTILSLTANIAANPSERDEVFHEIPDLDAGKCNVVFFSREGLHPFEFKSGFHRADVILISKSFRIVHLFENVVAKRHYSGTKPVFAAIILPDTFCRENGIQIGHFVDFKDVSYHLPRQAQSPDKDVAEARILLERNLARFPDDPAVRQDLGDFHIGTHDLESALKTFQDLIRIEPTAYRYIRLAQAQAAAGNIPAAQRSLEQSIILDPRSIHSYDLLMKLARSQDEQHAAMASMLSALDTLPDFDELRYELAYAFLKKEQFQDGLSILNHVSENETQNARFQRVRGDILLRQGEFRAAAEAYLMYLQMFPYDPHAADLRAFVTVHKFRKESLGL